MHRFQLFWDNQAFGLVFHKVVSKMTNVRTTSVGTVILATIACSALMVQVLCRPPPKYRDTDWLKGHDKTSIRAPPKPNGNLDIDAPLPNPRKLNVIRRLKVHSTAL
ncbi:hypothetical protein RvY_08027-2 [Ramazzottius varieornatus]|uniref:Uncharacterized protein n=1 Tax=Ramazzottius varieornatus TaxID=947166 RepID=A0A1D1V6T9_RAMVA|nr:hypothetical protein RvY_08027-2 [Ramazzottius varieornatus]